MTGAAHQAAAYENLSAELLAANLTVPRLLHVQRPQQGEWPLTLYLEARQLSSKHPFPQLLLWHFWGRSQGSDAALPTRRKGASAAHAPGGDQSGAAVAGGAACFILGASKGGAKGSVATWYILDLRQVGKVSWPPRFFWMLGYRCYSFPMVFPNKIHRDKLPHRLQLDAVPDGFRNRYLTSAEVKALREMAENLDARLDAWLVQWLEIIGLVVGSVWLETMGFYHEIWLFPVNFSHPPTVGCKTV